MKSVLEGRRKRVAIRVPNWIGDAVMAGPTIQALGHQFPEVEWHLFAIPRTAPLFEGLDFPFRLHPLPARMRGLRAWNAAVDQMRAVSPDAALILPPSFSSALLARLSGAEVRLGWPGDGRKALLTDVGPVPRRDIHLREQYHQLGDMLARRVLGRALRSDRPRLRFPLRSEEQAEASKWWEARQWNPSEVLVLAPGATYGPTKRWPEDRFAAVGRRWVERGRPVLWFGGPAEAELCRRLDARMEDAKHSFSLAGETSLRQSLALLADAGVLVSNDSGAMHMGQAAGLSVVAIFGSTSPTWTGPVGASQNTIYKAIHCSPCFAKTCPTSFECLDAISVDEVDAAATALWERAGLPASLPGAEVRTGSERRPAVFLDRDGTLIRFVDYLHRADDVELVPGAGAALRALRDEGFALVLVTNQSVVARGTIGLQELERIHLRLHELLAGEDVALDAVEVCPHHPDFTGPCSCRKPKPGMLLRAAQHLDLDLGRSWMIGDTTGDAGAAAAAGVGFKLVRTGYGAEVEASLSGVEACDDLVTASQSILSSLRTAPQR